MSRPPLTAAVAQHRLLLLSATRWFPVGLTIGLTVLLMLERGLTLSQIGIVFAAQGFVVLALELPTPPAGRQPLRLVSRRGPHADWPHGRLADPHDRCSPAAARLPSSPAAPDETSSTRGTDAHP